MSENGILEAEQRVREMNRMTRQYSEQGNLYLQSMRNAQNPQNFRQTRFEPAEPYPAGSPRGQYSSPNIPKNGSQNHQHNGQQNSRNRQNNNFPQNCPPNCPPAGDPAGERRNTPGQQNRQQNGQQMNSRNRSNFHTANFPPGILPPEEHIRNEIHNGQANQNPFPGFPDLIADNEKLMILLLIYLLMKEKADIKLILALGYLLL